MARPNKRKLRGICRPKYKITGEAIGSSLSRASSKKSSRSIIHATNNQTDSDASLSTSNGSGPSPLTEFHLFPKLPVELQVRIWGECVPDAIILIGKSQHKQVNGKNVKFNYYVRPVPTILQVCHLSRNEFLHRDGVKKDHPTYKLCSKLLNGQKERPVYVSMEQDIIQVRHLALLAKRELAHHQHLLFSHYGLRNHRFDLTNTKYGFDHFTNLQKLYYEGYANCNRGRNLQGIDKELKKAKLEDTLVMCYTVDMSGANYVRLAQSVAELIFGLHKYPLDAACLGMKMY